jgi:hypothetical protein
LSWVYVLESTSTREKEKKKSKSRKVEKVVKSVGGEVLVEKHISKGKKKKKIYHSGCSISLLKMK